jgi:hypothetical protein
VAGRPQQLGGILRCQPRCQPAHRGQVQPPLRDGLKDGREAPRRPRRADPQVGLVLGQPPLVDAEGTPPASSRRPVNDCLTDCRAW